MNTTIGHKLKSTIASLVIGMGLMLVSAADAAAHETEYRSHAVSRHYSLRATRAFPRWLQKNRDFQHWYAHSRYRSTRHVSWHRLYDIYHFEKHYRWQRRGIRVRDYRDDGYRTYQYKPRKHRH